MEMADSIHDSIIGKIFPDLNDWEALYTSDTEAMMEASEDLDDAIDDMADGIEDSMEIAGISVDDFKEKANEDFVAVQGEAKKTKEKIEELKNTVTTELPKAISGVQTFETKFNGYMDSIQQKIDNVVIPAITRLIENCKAGLAAQKALEEKDYSYTGNTVSGSNNGKTDNSAIAPISPPPNTTTTARDKKTIGGRDYVADDWSASYWSKGTASQEQWEAFKTGTSNDASGMISYHNSSIDKLETIWKEIDGVKAEITKNNTPIYKNYNQTEGLHNYVGNWTTALFKAHPDVTIKDVVNQTKTVNGKNEHYWAKVDITGDEGDTWLTKGTYWVPLNYLNKKNSLAYFSYDTGGYTGSWGPEGRLAMLHQKEIVLNAHDTENLLSIVSMVRDMNDRIELNARAMQYGLTAAYTANNIKSQNDTLQQEVHITAEFPNATNHSEIEEAFRNLTNLASQYANRKF